MFYLGALHSYGKAFFTQSSFVHRSGASAPLHQVVNGTDNADDDSTMMSRAYALAQATHSLMAWVEQRVSAVVEKQHKR